MPDPNGGAVQFFARRATAAEEKILDSVASKDGINGGRRWRSPQRPDAAVVRHTKSEAIAWFKELLDVKRLPEGFEIEAF